MKKIRVSAFVLPYLLVGCATEGADSPSLAPRPIEQRTDAIETPEPAPPAPADAALKADLGRLLKQARDGESAFAAILGQTERAVTAARGAAAASESWIAAQQQLSALDGARAPTAAALAELDSLYVALADKATQDARVGGIEEAFAARGEVESLNNRQIARLAALQAALSNP
ncbi:hypothetical protein [Sphingomonas sp. LaA6.9]|uniref:hypothetical protein n=1 Tax=Sphingomonas sp. LaA6.9 TaxID=2919914 RepID=UPI001F5001E2|nr:hypothetical protein [Sphingomonas sp. LaA6.9]MCJ8155838.1 hypothetical protein [Sphingomonas sp. LaA6.9]